MALLEGNTVVHIFLYFLWCHYHCFQHKLATSRMSGKLPDIMKQFRLSCRPNLGRKNIEREVKEVN